MRTRYADHLRDDDMSRSGTDLTDICIALLGILLVLLFILMLKRRQFEKARLDEAGAARSDSYSVSYTYVYESRTNYTSYDARNPGFDYNMSIN